MTESPNFPFDIGLRWDEAQCKLPIHRGTVAANIQGIAHHFEAQFFIPPQGDCLILINSQSGLSRKDLLTESELTIVGNTSEEHFTAYCPELRVKAYSEFKETPAWIVGSPINKPMTIEYGPSPPPISKVDALINGFDFSLGNAEWEGSPIIRTMPSGIPVEFRWRKSRTLLRRLLDCEIIHTSALCHLSFEAWEGSSEEEIVKFVHSVASLCIYAVGQYTGVPLITLSDSDGKPVKRIINSPIESKFRQRGALDERYVPNGTLLLFEQCFDEHIRMCASNLPWRKLSSYCAAIEDAPTLEQKFASLMMALEFLLRNSLMEGATNLAAAQVERLTFSELIGAAKKYLGWKVPKHYAAAGLVRLIRNAVMHGGDLPIKDSREFRETFDKWKLFLFRRVLIRLGYRGKVLSPHQKYWSASPVDDFSEEHNSFRYG